MSVLRAHDFDSMHNVSAGKHFYQFYKTTDDYLRVVMPFFQAGLEKHEACLWIVAEKMNPGDVRAFVKMMVPGFDEYEKSGQFQILSSESWYATRGHFDESKAFKNIKTYAEMIESKGFDRARIVGDASSVPKKEWPLLYAYEKKTDQWIRASSFVCICAYPILECSISDTKAILDAHRDGVLNGFL